VLAKRLLAPRAGVAGRQSSHQWRSNGVQHSRTAQPQGRSGPARSCSTKRVLPLSMLTWVIPDRDCFWRNRTSLRPNAKLSIRLPPGQGRSVQTQDPPIDVRVTDADAIQALGACLRDEGVVRGRVPDAVEPAGHPVEESRRGIGVGLRLGLCPRPSRLPHALRQLFADAELVGKRARSSLAQGVFAAAELQASRVEGSAVVADEVLGICSAPEPSVSVQQTGATECE